MRNQRTGRLTAMDASWQLTVNSRFARWACVGLVLTTASARLGAQPSADGNAAKSSGKAAVVKVEVLTDGRCAVSAKGEGFRSNATYKPQTAEVAGEHRCAMPPVKEGLPVDLSVVLPKGAEKPGTSEPALLWAQDGEQWTGTASLTRWPDVIVVTPPRRLWTFWGPVGTTLLVAAIAIRRRRTRPALLRVQR